MGRPLCAAKPRGPSPAPLAMAALVVACGGGAHPGTGVVVVTGGGASEATDELDPAFTAAVARLATEVDRLKATPDELRPETLRRVIALLADAVERTPSSTGELAITANRIRVQGRDLVGSPRPGNDATDVLGVAARDLRPVAERDYHRAPLVLERIILLEETVATLRGADDLRPSREQLDAGYERAALVLTSMVAAVARDNGP
jgi:hypothetical protein